MLIIHCLMFGDDFPSTASKDADLSNSLRKSPDTNYILTSLDTRQQTTGHFVPIRAKTANRQVPACLETNNCRSRYSRHCSRLQNTFSSRSIFQNIPLLQFVTFAQMFYTRRQSSASLNLGRNINKKFHFQRENISCLKSIIQQGDFMTTVDLKDAYLSVPVYMKHHRSS